ncbi:copper homeostasis protein CutC [Clostridium polynesiense]|uniref:copper homeostasis protein CutC n=1 Tax=Clostridium polynesiense TaxID=1325933 RepID=UPI00058D6DA1|nr:copper homeostasis protein CutC [Clostridium polynesiense]
MKYIIEACVDSAESAIEAEKGGADRLELCSNLIIGGTTPSINLFKLVKEKVGIAINVLIRPRFGDFLYTENELEIIKREIQMFKEAGANAVVIGVLKSDGTLDVENMKKLMNVAEGMKVTLHRAFDVCRDPFKTLEDAKTLGIDTILTSGQKNKCTEGLELIKELVERSKGKVEILVGSGVNSTNADRIIKHTNATSLHLSGRVDLDSGMEYRKEEVSMGLPLISEYTIQRTSAEEIKKVRDLLVTGT